MEVQPTKISFKDTAVMLLASFLTFIALIPLVLYFAPAMAMIREDLVKQTLVLNGLHPVTYFLSWLIVYTVVCAFYALYYAGVLKIVLFTDNSFSLLFTVIFLCFQSFFGLIHIYQQLFNSTRMAFFMLGFSIFLSYFFFDMINQDKPPLPFRNQQIAAIAHVTALRLTMNTFSNFYVLGYAMTWENYDLVIKNWSLGRGIDALITNFFIYLGISIALDLIFNVKEHFKNIFLRRVVFLDSDDNVIELKSVCQYQHHWTDDNCPTFNYTFKKSEVCFLIGNNLSTVDHFL